MRFIGSKAKLLPFLDEHIGREIAGGTTFADLFCGTATVSAHFRRHGYRVVANDNLFFCTTFAKARLLLPPKAPFSGLEAENEIPKDTPNTLSQEPYHRTLAHLNSLAPSKGFIYENYSPGGTRNQKWVRKYFTDENAQRIDSVRDQIDDWSSRGLLGEGEEALLIADLLEAVSKVSNTAGTYGFFLKHWNDKRAKRQLQLTPSEWPEGNGNHEVYWDDAIELSRNIKADVIYLDPPYTWRHYGAYYHLLETIARWDDPQLSGKTGLRPWHDSRSPFCYPDEAQPALANLIERANAKHLFLSYNSDGLMDHNTIIETLASRGNVECHEVRHQRYKSSSKKEGENNVAERLYHVRLN